jgi:hypothetical protein
MSDARASKPVLKIDWCTHEAARYAVENWHYSKRMPAGALTICGAWENGKYIGCVIFGRGANHNAGSPYALRCTEIAELVRVALTTHVSEVSKIVAVAIRFLRKQAPGLRLLFSYADPAEGHHGGIYQAGGWVYVGTSQPQAAVVMNGKILHKRSVSSVRGTIKGAQRSAVTWKHKYLFPLDAAMAAQIAPLSKPYPKRPAKSSPSGTTTGEGGALPTAGL